MISRHKAAGDRRRNVLTAVRDREPMTLLMRDVASPPLLVVPPLVGCAFAGPVNYLSAGTLRHQRADLDRQSERTFLA